MSNHELETIIREILRTLKEIQFNLIALKQQGEKNEN